MGRRGIRGLKTRVGWEFRISQGGLDCTAEVYMSEESEERGAAPGVRAGKSSEFGEGKL